MTSTAEKGSACKQCTAGQENIEAAHKPCVGSLPGEALAQCAGCVGVCGGCGGGLITSHLCRPTIFPGDQNS